VILVTGATGYVGRFLVRRLVEQGKAVRCLVRPSSDCRGLERGKVELCIGDLEKPESLGQALAGARIILHLAHIRLAPPLLERAEAGLERAVLVSSLRRFSRVPSASVEQVQEAEERLRRLERPWVLVRPSMIYGPGDDRNIARLAAWLRQNRFFPVFGSGRHLQQPVFVEDVVAGVLAATERPQALGKCYALAGREALTYEALIDAVAAAVGARPIKVHVPVWLALAGIEVLKRLGLGLEGEQILRLQEDKVFSIEEARRDLGYEPLSFAEGLERIYGG
jgi:nucleoside-diphosphate-sugar epimerase